MKDGTYLLFSPEGEFKLTLKSETIQISDEIRKDLLAGSFLGSSNLMDITEQTAGYFSKVKLLVGAVGARWIAKVERLSINTSFLLRDGIHYPTFDHKSGEPMSMVWRPPKDMNLQLCVTVMPYCDRANKVTTYYADTHWMAAFDSAGEAYMLPIGNLYSDCKLCHGFNSGYQGDQYTVFMAALKHFNSSPYNTDLYEGANIMERTASLFRWKPTDSGFDQLPVNADGENWRRLCEKVVGPHLEGWL